MAGWICHTRKMLYSAIASLADDLEQTVQDFNDAIQRLNSSNVSGTPRADQRDHVSGTPRTDQRDKNERQEPSDKPSDPQHSQGQQKGQNCAVPQLQHVATPQHYSTKQQQCSAARQQGTAAQQKCTATQQQCTATQQQYSAPQQQYSATTRQPETSRSLSAPTQRLAHSFPSHQVSDNNLPKLPELGHTVFQKPDQTSSSTSSCTRCTLSLSSPCSTHSTESAHAESAHENETSTISEREFASFNNRSIPRTVDRTVRSSRPPHPCPCHQKQSLQANMKDIGFKRPGKVVRTHTLATERQDRKVRQQPHSKEDEELPKAVVNVERAGRCRQAQERSGSARSSSLALTEDTRLLRWAGLRPLTSMLSFAVNQLSSLLHLLTDEHVNCQTLTSRREIMSTPVPGTKVTVIDTGLHQGQGQSESTSMTDNTSHDIEESTLHGEKSTLHGEECNLHGEESTLHGRTYSTESFVVIDSPSCSRDPEEGRDGHGQTSENHRSLAPGRGNCVYPNGPFLTGWSDCGHSVDCGQVTEIVSSSVEWASFDVGKLLRDGHVGSWRPGSDISLGLGQTKHSGPDSLLGESDPNVLGSGKANIDGAAMTDHTCEVTKETEEEEDCDSSVSIIALSDLDDSGEDGFIFF